MVSRGRVELAASGRATEDRHSGTERVIDAAYDGETRRAGVVGGVADGEAERR
jgi:hypothetical protein